MRKATPLFKDGELNIIADQKYGPGVFAYQLSNDKESYMVIFNTSNSKKVLANVIPEHSIKGPLKLIYSLQSEHPPLAIDQGGALTGILELRRV